MPGKSDRHDWPPTSRCSCGQCFPDTAATTTASTYVIACLPCSPRRPEASHLVRQRGCGEVIEEHAAEPSRLKELVLVIEWKSPLHVVVIVDTVREEERIVTVYEPDPDRWSHDYRRRRL